MFLHLCWHTSAIHALLMYFGFGASAFFSVLKLPSSVDLQAALTYTQNTHLEGVNDAGLHHVPIVVCRGVVAHVEVLKLKHLRGGISKQRAEGCTLEGYASLLLQNTSQSGR